MFKEAEYEEGEHWLDDGEVFEEDEEWEIGSDRFSQDGTESETWADAAAQVAFRERVLSKHIERKQKTRGAPQRDLASTEITKITDTSREMRSDAAVAAGALLAQATVALAAAKAAGDADALRTISVTAGSAYRSATKQAEVWRGHFVRYYEETAVARAALPDGPHGDSAVTYMLDDFGITWRVAAPGYSNHQAGIAVDWQQVRPKRFRVANSTSSRARGRWRQTWFFGWLQKNARTFGFHPYKKEPWHWEYKGVDDTSLVPLGREYESQGYSRDIPGASVAEYISIAPVRMDLACSNCGSSDFLEVSEGADAPGGELSNFSALAVREGETEGWFGSVFDGVSRIFNPSLLRRGKYDRTSAIGYARSFWQLPCDDQFIATGPTAGTNARHVPAGTVFRHNFDADGSPVGTEHALLPDGSTIPWSHLDDCTHFISCCVGQRPGYGSGGLRITYKQLGQPPNAPYGIVRAPTLVNFISGRINGHPKYGELVAEETQDESLISLLEPGDLIAYYGLARRRYSHIAMLLDDGKIACHSYSRSDQPECTWDRDWALGRGTHSWTFIRITA